MLTWKILFLAFVECKKNYYKQFLKEKRKKKKEKRKKNNNNNKIFPNNIS